MRKILILILLVSYSVVVARTSFNKELADSLISQIELEISSEESYYLINSNQKELDSYLLLNLSDASVDLRMDQSMASKSIYYSINEELSIISKRSFIFSREVRKSEFLAEAKIVDNLSSRIEEHLSFSKVEESPLVDGGLSLWKPALISLMTGTLIYSLWSIE